MQRQRAPLDPISWSCVFKFALAVGFILAVNIAFYYGLFALASMGLNFWRTV